MAYADRNTSGSRAVSIVIVSVIVALFAWGFVNGLTFKYIKKVTEKLNTFDVVEPPPPPPDKPPPPPPEQPQLQTPPVVSPPPIVRVQSTAAACHPAVDRSRRPRRSRSVPQRLHRFPLRRRRSDGEQGRRLKRAIHRPTGSPTDDYPSDALSAEAQGTSKIRWDINTAGRVENCTDRRFQRQRVAGSRSLQQHDTAWKIYACLGSERCADADQWPMRATSSGAYLPSNPAQ